MAGKTIDCDPGRDEHADCTYAGFWVRAVAAVIDSILVCMIALPALLWAYGAEYFDLVEDAMFAGPLDFLVQFAFPACATVLFWTYRQATPGKMAFAIKIVDARTGGKPSPRQCIGRYFAYFLSIVALFLGFLWIAFDGRKQGWHDKLANTVVVRNRKKPAVRFPS